MGRKGILTPAESGEFITRHAKHVKIHEEGIDKISKLIVSSISDQKQIQIPDTGAKIAYLPKDDPRAVDWIFVADTLNFCFWSYPEAQKWTVSGHTGYYALEAALARAIQEGKDITNPEYYSKITEEEFRHLMRGDNQIEAPLIKERISALHEVGKVLIEKYNGTFTTCLKEANKSAVKLLEIVIENFPCFRDEATYENKQISCYKRAQILVADVWNFFKGESWGEFSDIEKITMFADYRIPQVLVHFGAMSYSEELMEKLKNDILLPSGSEEEVEIRGCSIHVVELLKGKIKELLRQRQQEVKVPNSSSIAYYLWCYRRKYADDLKKTPFHKTLGIFY